MDIEHNSNNTNNNSSSRYSCIPSSTPDDVSDSGLSSFRSSNGSSGDERSTGSRCSIISSSEDTPPTNKSPSLLAEKFFPHRSSPPVWRDPNLVLSSTPTIRHIDSVQHRSLLMSHNSTTSAASSVTVSTVSSSTLPPSTTSAVHHYPPHMLAPHPTLHQLPPHHSPAALYSQLPEMLWKQQRYAMPTMATTAHHLHSTTAAEELLDRERSASAYLHDRERQERLHREREQREREVEKQIHQQKEREKEKQQQQAAERERAEKERLEKQRAEQAVHKHFEETFSRLAQQTQPKGNNCWKLITSSLPPPSAAISRSVIRNEEERKKLVEQEQQHQQQQRIMRPEPREREKVAPVGTFAPYNIVTTQKVQPASNKPEYIPGTAIGTTRIAAQTKPQVAAVLPKSEPGYNVYGYPAYQAPLNFIPQDKVLKVDQLKKVTPGGLVINSVPLGVSVAMERERENSLAQGHPLMELKNNSSVIVKNESKPHHLVEVTRHQISSHSSSPKLRAEVPPQHHYLQPPSSNIKYEYHRSPTHSPLQVPHPNAVSPHQLHHPDSKLHHRQTSAIVAAHRQSPHPRQSPLPPQQSQQPYHRQSPHPSSVVVRSIPSPPEQRYPNPAAGITMYTKQSVVGSYPYSSPVTNVHNVPVISVPSKPKVNSPAPPHIYGKPSGVIIGGNTSSSAANAPTPVHHEIRLSPLAHHHHPPPPPAPPAALPLSSRPVITPSPYQQLSRHQLPPVSSSLSPNSVPPRAHSNSTTYFNDPRLVLVPPFPSSSSSSSLAGKLPDMASQIQPLDLGVKDLRASPKRKWDDHEPPVLVTEEIMKKPRNSMNDETSTISIAPSYPSPSASNQRLSTAVIANTGVIASKECPVPPVTASVIVSATTHTVPVSSTAQTKSPPPQINKLCEPEKSASPKPASYSGHKLKKAWLQRHKDCSEDKNSSLVIKNGMLSTPRSPAADGASKSETANALVVKSPSGSTATGDLEKNVGSDEDSNDTRGEDTNRCASSSPASTVASLAESNGNASPPVIMANTLKSIGSMAVNSISKGKGGKIKKSKDNRKNAPPSVPNGHLSTNDGSSSSETESNKTSPKRIPPKLKRKRYISRKVDEQKRRKLTSTSSSTTDSDKETGSEKDTDNSAGVEKKPMKEEKQNAKEMKKRGRKPKNGAFSFGSKNDSSSASSNNGEGWKDGKKADDANWKDPFPKPPMGQLKKTGESFLQDGPCFEVAPKLAKCRECRWTPNQRSRNNIFCRFYAFRRLRYTKNGQLAIAGFSDPHKDPSQEDTSLWLPNINTPPTDLDIGLARFLLCRIGDQFCDLLRQENEALAINISEDKKIAWKRVVQGVREMCDVCETTLFNFHWACSKCGFVVCIDCYKGRKNGCSKIWGEPARDKDDVSWLFCTNRQPHEQDKLILTQIIAADCVSALSEMAHKYRYMWEIPVHCGCPPPENIEDDNAFCKSILRKWREEQQRKVTEHVNNGKLKNLELTTAGDHKQDLKNNNNNANSALSWFADVALMDGNSESPEAIQAAMKEVGADEFYYSCEMLPNIEGYQYRSAMPKYWQPTRWREQLPVRYLTVSDSKHLYPGVPHTWLCDGKLLRLSDPEHPGNFTIFQDQWRRGQPVVVSEVSKKLNKDLWHPESFIKDFGDIKNDLVNCANGNVVPNQPMKKFWEGFECPSRRLRDDKGNGMLLKLKDWPPVDDFAEMLPSRFADLMNALPLTEYTHRTGRLNLASRLPECFVRPDLGPKMYNAYGSPLCTKKGTTNLHLDISDAVNVMVYVGIPKDGDSEEFIKAAYRAIDEAGCDMNTRRRVRAEGEIPGALWHIYHARDAKKIREMLNKVAVERGIRQEPHHDPIHDQEWYLDGALRERLYKEYGVEGYSIVQCLGDAVFIPAGAPHQVRNLHNCIKVAEDFVSPENVSNCFTLTEEFRNLSESHVNREDKLQIKNIMYHAVKDSLSVLGAAYAKAKATETEQSDVCIKVPVKDEPRDEKSKSSNS